MAPLPPQPGEELPALPAELEGIVSNAPDSRFYVVESCHSTWLFDLVDKRFCRVLKNVAFASTIATDWRSFDRLVMHPSSDAFIVFLDPAGARLLRSWRHRTGCTHCATEVTTQLSLEELRKLTGSAPA